MQMSEPWGERYFQDHSALALSCPNVPVLIDYLLDRRPVVQNTYVQLMDHLALENIVKEDRFTRLPQPNHGLSFVWDLLDPAFGMHGVRRQYESLCLGGRFEPGKNTDVWDATTEPRNVMKLLESVVAANVVHQVQAPKRRDFRPSTEVKPVVKDLAYVADATP